MAKESLDIKGRQYFLEGELCYMMLRGKREKKKKILV